MYLFINIELRCLFSIYLVYLFSDLFINQPFLIYSWYVPVHAFITAQKYVYCTFILNVIWLYLMFLYYEMVFRTFQKHLPWSQWEG